MDLKFFSKLQSSDTVSLVLRNNSGNILDYYIISETVSHCAIACGKCPGYLDKDMSCFNIRIGSIMPLIEKGYKLNIHYEDGELLFVSDDERMEIKPLYVEYRDPNAVKAITKLIEFETALEKRNTSLDKIEQLTHEISLLRTESQNSMKWGISRINLSTSQDDKLDTVQYSDPYTEQISEKEGKLLQLQKESYGITDVDLEDFGDIALVAARSREVVNFCGTYSLTKIDNCYLFRKCNCPVMAISGQLLSTLIRDGDGKNFFFFDNELVYVHGTKEHTLVFISRYLPNIDVDDTILTRGVVEEKYTIKLRDVLDVFSLVKGKFDDIKLDMGNGYFLLSNSNGEIIKMKFDIDSAKTIQLNRLMHNSSLSTVVSMSTIDIPKSTRSLLPLFKSNLTIYVKKKKVIFQNSNLYLVFSR